MSLLTHTADMASSSSAAAAAAAPHPTWLFEDGELARPVQIPRRDIDSPMLTLRLQQLGIESVELDITQLTNLAALRLIATEDARVNFINARLDHYTREYTTRDRLRVCRNIMDVLGLECWGAPNSEENTQIAQIVLRLLFVRVTQPVVRRYLMAHLLATLREFAEEEQLARFVAYIEWIVGTMQGLGWVVSTPNEIRRLYANNSIATKWHPSDIPVSEFWASSFDTRIAVDAAWLSVLDAVAAPHPLVDWPAPVPFFDEWETSRPLHADSMCHLGWYAANAMRSMDVPHAHTLIHQMATSCNTLCKLSMIERLVEERNPYRMVPLFEHMRPFSVDPTERMLILAVLAARLGQQQTYSVSLCMGELFELGFPVVTYAQIVAFCNEVPTRRRLVALDLWPPSTFTPDQQAALQEAWTAAVNQRRGPIARALMATFVKPALSEAELLQRNITSQASAHGTLPAAVATLVGESLTGGSAQHYQALFQNAYDILARKRAMASAQADVIDARQANRDERPPRGDRERKQPGAPVAAAAAPRTPMQTGGRGVRCRV